MVSAWFMRSGVPAFRVCFRSAEGRTGASLARFSVIPGGRCGFVDNSRFPAFGLLFVFGCLCLRFGFGFGFAFRLGGGFCFPFCFADGTGTGPAVFRRDRRRRGRTDRRTDAGRGLRFGDPLNSGVVGCRALWARVSRFCFRL